MNMKACVFLSVRVHVRVCAVNIWLCPACDLGHVKDYVHKSSLIAAAGDSTAASRDSQRFLIHYKCNDGINQKTNTHFPPYQAHNVSHRHLLMQGMHYLKVYMYSASL